MSEAEDANYSPKVAAIICNAVLVCTCPSKTLMVLNLMGGTIECPACRRNWYSPKMTYEINHVTKSVQVACIVDEVPKIVLSDGIGLINFKEPGGGGRKPS